MERFSGVVLTGGRSERFGRDKALVSVGGRAMAAVVAAALADAGASEVLAIGGDREALAAIGLAVVPDWFPGEGPLGAIVTAFAVVAEPMVVVLACDLAAITASVVEALVAGLDDHDVAVPASDRLHPLCAAYHVASAAPVMERAFSAGERAVHRALVGLRVARVELPDPAALRNVNRPEDLPR